MPPFSSIPSPPPAAIDTYGTRLSYLLLTAPIHLIVVSSHRAMSEEPHPPPPLRLKNIKPGQPIDQAGDFHVADFINIWNSHSLELSKQPTNAASMASLSRQRNQNEHSTLTLLSNHSLPGFKQQNICLGLCPSP